MGKNDELMIFFMIFAMHITERNIYYNGKKNNITNMERK